MGKWAIRPMAAPASLWHSRRTGEGVSTHDVVDGARALVYRRTRGGLRWGQQGVNGPAGLT